MAARAFNQATKFGAVLDMVTDRCTTSCLLCFLSAAHPEYTFVFQFLISIDLASHYMHMYSTLNQGVASHKKIPANQAWILRLYYGNNVCFRPCHNRLTCYRLSFSSFAPSTSCFSLLYTYLRFRLEIRQVLSLVSPLDDVQDTD